MSRVGPTQISYEASIYVNERSFKQDKLGFLCILTYGFETRNQHADVLRGLLLHGNRLNTWIVQVHC